MASVILREELRCSICLLVFKDPAMLGCGHNFCRVCIDRLLDTQAQDESGVYSCPECREQFQERPALMRNINLQNVAKRFLTTQPDQEEITGIWCTYCVDFSVPAVKSCLHCETSVCDKHLNVHSKEAEHVLCEPRTSLENRKCSVHKKILEYYCPEDAACICVSCRLAGEHRGHQVEMLEEASEKKKKKLRNVLPKLSTKREETEERIESLQNHCENIKGKADREAKRVTAVFFKIRMWLQYLEEKMKREILRQRNEVKRPLDEMVSKLEIKKDQLSKKIRHIEELCNMTDPLTVLQDPETGDFCDPEEGERDEDTGGHVEPLHNVDQDMAVINDKLRRLRDIISGVRSGIYVEGPADILLDVNTANNSILISDDRKTATCSQWSQNRTGAEERFHDCPQVMSSRRFSSGRHYWDVEISGSRNWRVGMCYPSMDRRGGQSYIGDNNKSWGLCKKKTWFNNDYYVIHDREEIRLPDNISSDTVRICLDYEAGELSFYELCDPIRHLHTFTATFSEPLHAALCVLDGSIKVLEGTSSRNRNNGMLL